MQKFMPLVCALALIGSAGPTGAAEKWSAGVKGGANFADVDGDDAPGNTEMRTGFQGGGFARFEFAPGFGAQGEVLYVQKGVKGSITTEDADVHQATYKADYIDLPILLDAIFAAGDKLAFNLFGGPSFNFNLSAERDIEEHGTEDLEGVKSFEFGAVIGGGVRYRLSSASILAEVRYSLGASTIQEDVLGESVDMKNRGIGVMAGVSFPLGGGAQ